MNTLEIKGAILELIARLDDKKLLLKAHKKLVKLVDKYEATQEEEFELPPYALKELDAAIEAAKDPKNLVSHEEVMKKSKKWSK